MDIEFGVLKREDLKEAVEMSVRAYEDYAYFANYFPDTTERLKMLWAVMYRGWLQISGSWYYYGSDGAMVTGKKTINGKVYTFDANGVMQ